MSDGDKVVPGDNLCKIKLTGKHYYMYLNTSYMYVCMTFV